jgi:hypothetical protein
VTPARRCGPALRAGALLDRRVVGAAPTSVSPWPQVAQISLIIIETLRGCLGAIGPSTEGPPVRARISRRLRPPAEQVVVQQGHVG